MHSTAAPSNEVQREDPLALNYGALSPAASPTARGLRSPADRDTQELLANESRTLSTSPMGETPDQILNSFGACNPFVLFVFSLMAFVWAVAAMPMMTSAWLLGDVCAANATDCTLTPGTITEEFNLTGADAKFSDLTSMAFLLGNALGSSPVTRFSDLKGRRAGLLLALIGYGAFGLVTAFCSNKWQFIVLRALQGAFFPGVGVINWVMGYESSPMSLRQYAPLVFGLWWVLGYCALAPLAFYFPHWRTIMVGASLPSLICAGIFFFVLPESFHWLIINEKEEQLQKWLDSANRWSSRPRSDLNAALIIRNHHKTGHSKESTKTTGILQELLNRRVLLLYTIILGYLVGGIFAPLSRALASIWILLPAVCFAVLSGVGGLATLVLPETKNRELPDSSSEIGAEEIER
ncbi:MFS domain-containing protein [Aphelenchoides fujianensis]|nr:MFS domain-containing protein [Aphelenchoides fujianensis]